jgi:hypothetical protein
MDNSVMTGASARARLFLMANDEWNEGVVHPFVIYTGLPFPNACDTLSQVGAHL